MKQEKQKHSIQYMKRFSIFVATMMMVSVMQAAEKLDLKSITSGAFSASYVTGINPIEGTDLVCFHQQ